MGLSLSSSLAFSSFLQQSLESVVLKSTKFGDGAQKTPDRSISFKNEDSDPKILLSLGSGRTLVEGSISFQTEELEIADAVGCSGNTALSVDSRFDEMFCLGCLPSMSNIEPGSPILDPSNPKHEAAIKLQKVYKSFRTRRKLADCAVLIEQSWWKLLDFAELKHSSISFFDREKHETPISRWSRAGTRAAKVGKGLSKNGKARKLAIQHWLEAIDPRHRYGHNLHFYYVNWLHSQGNQPFFYWLDIGEGKEVNLVEKCPRSKLQQQCIKYLGPMERKAYEVAVEDGKLFYKESGEFLDTIGGPEGSKWIFVLSSSKVLYVGKKRKGTFQHSSFLAGGATLAAGMLVVDKGKLKVVWPHSGHYQPTPENFQDFITFLRENNVDLTDVKLDLTERGEESSVKNDIVLSRSNSSEDGLIEEDGIIAKEKDNENLATTIDNIEEKTPPALHCNEDSLESLKRKCDRNGREGDEPSEELFVFDEQVEHHEHKLPLEEVGVPKEEIISQESILERINSHYSSRSFQLGQQLACRWSTGAGPRIGCVRDYPSGLQSHVLEQVSLSPRTTGRLILDKPFQEAEVLNLSHSVSSHFRPQFSQCKGVLTASAPTCHYRN